MHAEKCCSLSRPEQLSTGPRPKPYQDPHIVLPGGIKLGGTLDIPPGPSCGQLLNHWRGAPFYPTMEDTTVQGPPLLDASRTRVSHEHPNHQAIGYGGVGYAQGGTDSCFVQARGHLTNCLCSKRKLKREHGSLASRLGRSLGGGVSWIPVFPRRPTSVFYPKHVKCEVHFIWEYPGY